MAVTPEMHPVVDEEFAAENEEQRDAADDLRGVLIQTVVVRDLDGALVQEGQQEGDQRHGREDDKPWNEKVDEAFMIAYQAAKHKFNKECGNVLKRFTCDVLGGVIINDLITKIVETVGNLIGTLTSQIPDEVKEMINLEEMAKDDVRDILTGTFEGAVYDQNNAFEEELNKAIENCQI